eukprot:5779983-Prymnesium_polylepis.1
MTPPQDPHYAWYRACNGSCRAMWRHTRQSARAGVAAGRVGMGDSCAEGGWGQRANSAECKMRAASAAIVGFCKRACVPRRAPRSGRGAPSRMWCGRVRLSVRVLRHGATRRCQPERERGRATAGEARAALYSVTRPNGDVHGLGVSDGQLVCTIHAQHVHAHVHVLT